MRQIKKMFQLSLVIISLFSLANSNKLIAQFQYPPYIPIDTLSIATEEFTPKEIIMLSLNLLGDDGNFQIISGSQNGYISELVQFELDSMKLDKALGGYMPNYGFIGEEIVSYEAVNSYGSSGEKYIKINVYDPAHPPPSIPDSLTVYADLSQTITIELTSTDGDNDDATFEITSDPFLGNITNIEQFTNTGNSDRAIVTYQSTFQQSDMFTYIAKDNDGSSSTGVVFIKEQAVGIDANTSTPLSDRKLKQNYPNPFNPMTKINYELGITNFELAEIVVYNAMGQMVWSLPITDHSSPITEYCLFDGSKFNSGIYYYSLIVDGKKIDTRSMILIK